MFVYILGLFVAVFFNNICPYHGSLFGRGAGQRASRPNIIFLLTDDQDLTMGSMKSMTKLKELVGDKGAVFSNMFVTSPLCCPSRSSILTGKYVHNHGAVNNSISGNCSSRSWQKNSEIKAFPTYLKLQGYRTFFAGKYLNQYGKDKAGGVKHVPPGWDEWHGLVGNSRYYNYTLSVNGEEEVHGDTYEEDYLTDVIGRKAKDFLDGQSWWEPRPFFMMLSTPSCHAPFTPAPQYKGHFSNQSAPRGGSFGVYGKDKHWLLRYVKHPMSNATINYIDEVFRNRWRTLLSVDDMVESLMTKLEKQGLLNNTYFVFTSDNGYHLGQFSLPDDKRQLYDFDVRVPFMIRGPGITPGKTYDEPVLNIDLAPTFLDLAGLKTPDSMDGRSILPLVRHDRHRKNAVQTSEWRNEFLIEHQGEWKKHNNGCPQYDGMKLSNCFPDCVCEDAANNTYQCLRVKKSPTDIIFCQFADAEDFLEVYNMHSDPHQMVNIARVVDPNLLAEMDARLIKQSVCSGKSCRDPEPLDHLIKLLNKTPKKRAMFR